MRTDRTSDTYELIARLERRGIHATFAQANTLRRAELTLRGWYEQECGNSNDYASWAIERDEATEIPYRVVYPHNVHNGGTRRHRIPDREAGAKRRVEAVAKELGIHVYYHGDPRGCSLYVSVEPFEDFNYTNGVCCCYAGGNLASYGEVMKARLAKGWNR